MTYGEIAKSIIEDAEKRLHIVFANEEAKWSFVESNCEFTDDRNYTIRCIDPSKSSPSLVYYLDGEPLWHYAPTLNWIDGQYHDELYVGCP